MGAIKASFLIKKPKSSTMRQFILPVGSLLNAIAPSIRWFKLRDQVSKTRLPNGNYETFRRGIENENPEICANVIIGLIKVTTYLLYKQICVLEEEFLQNGGLRERMTQARLAVRNDQAFKPRR
jgi:four helix bundle suffix protein